MAFFIFTNGTTLRSNLTESFGVTDAALNNMSTWAEVSVPAESAEEENGEKVMLNRTAFQSRLNDFR